MYNGYYYGFDMTYLVLVVPALLIALIAQIQVKSAFSRYAGVRCTSGLTGAQAAQRILQANGITDVRIEHISGKLTDHFDPQAKVIRLSDEVYGVASIAAVGVAAHEAGHAVQYATDYAPIRIRAAIIGHAHRLQSLVAAAHRGADLQLVGARLGGHFALRPRDGVPAGDAAGGVQRLAPRAGGDRVAQPAHGRRAARRAQRPAGGRHDVCRGAAGVVRAAAAADPALRQPPPELTPPLQSTAKYRKIAGTNGTCYFLLG